MARWADFAGAEPEMARVLTESLAGAPIAFLATVRKDGAPRVHPFCPIFAGSGLFIAVPVTDAPHPSPKRFDLQNDDRYAMHSRPGDHDEEFYVTGTALRIDDPANIQAVAAAAGHNVHAHDWTFELRIDRAMTAHWENWAQPTTYAVRRFWHAQ